MEIELLQLVGNKRLLLRNIKSFEIRPNSIHQIIIGTNGSGKSTILRELSPLPPASKDFIKGGSKTIRLRHQGRHFHLHTDFSVGNGKHEFYVEDGDNLNPGGTATVQKELIKQWFNYDDKIHRILMGIQRFSTIPAMQRRDLLMDLSGANLDFAFTLWQTLKGLHRDQQGVVKHLSGRLAHETDRLLDPAAIGQLEEQSTFLTDELTSLMSHREPGLPNEIGAKGRVTSILGIIHDLSARIQKAELTPPDWLMPGQVKTVDDVNELIADTQADIARSEAVLAKYMDEYEELKTIVDALQTSTAQGAGDIRMQIDELKVQRASAFTRISVFTDVDSADIADTYARTIAIFPQVVDVMSTLPVNKNRYYSRQGREAVEGTLKANRALKTDLMSSYSRVQHQIEHIKTAQHANCPKCGYVWQPGFENYNEAEVTKRFGQIESKLKGLDILIDNDEQYLEAYQRYVEVYRRFQILVDTATYLNPFWEYVLTDELQFESPASTIPMLETWMNDLRVHTEIAECDRLIALFEDALAKSENAGGTEGYDKRLERVVTNIEQYTEASIDANRRLNQTKQYHLQIKRVLADFDQLKVASKELNANIDNWIRVIRRDNINQVIAADQNDLAQMQSKLNTLHAIQSLIEDLQVSLDKAKNDLESYKILVDEISPVDGLIADQLKGFIGTFVEQINDIVEQIWTYELKILPCGLDDNGLDYKFGMVVNGEPAGDDVRDSDASTGQLEVIDFAFKLVTMLYRGMTDFPLFLDELGPHMDVEHRNNIMRFVHSLVETKRCSQLWLVSHFSSMHEIFNNVEYCVMDERNVALPSVYNRHVTFG